MSAEKQPRIVAELGRPETAQESADRKAASSQAYRNSKTFHNLVVALLATLAIVAVVIFAVPRGEVPATGDIDVAAVADDVANGYNRDVIVADVPDSWLVNGAAVSGDSALAWTVIYVPDETSYLRVSQAFDSDDAWARTTLSGAAPSGTTTIDGVTWDVYDIGNPEASGNISYALGTQAGTDHVLIYGTSDEETARTVAASMSEQIKTLQGGIS